MITQISTFNRWLCFSVKYLYGLLLLAAFTACDEEEELLFATLPPASTGIHFSNDLQYSEDYNPYTYRNFYNGGGVALGDLNNDGLTDLYFSGNLVDNKLYVNRGDWQFEDVTAAAGVACPDVWSSGVNLVDINGDGWLDIYVCKAGKPKGKNRHNELFINQGDLTFVESAAEYGLDITGLSIQSAFFDYDLDGDLDVYLLKNSLRSVGGFDMREGLRDVYDAEGNQLLENRDGKFVDVTQTAGIYSSGIGYGLGITLADFNADGWPDIFLSNDFFEKDYLYFNQQDGTFAEMADRSFTSLSMGSMGADASDLDNDLRPEVFVTEMLPRAADRKKTKTAYETWDKYQLAVDKGYHHQFARNALHKNLNGERFVEVGRLAGVESTEWSWSALIQDYDNDGLRDLFISNGIRSDLLDKDYLNYMANDTRIRAMIDEDQEVLRKLIDIMPSGAVSNAIFRNRGNLQFTYESDNWGLSAPTFSNGSAYADLDNDGDLDLVVNNIDQPATLYRNNAASKSAPGLNVALRYQGENTSAIGAKVLIVADSLRGMFEYYPTKGFQSCSAVPVFFGVGERSTVDSLIVVWPNGEMSLRTQVATGGIQTIDYQESERVRVPFLTPSERTTVLTPAENDLAFDHREIGLNHFNQERMLLSMPGRQGPGLAVADLNGDGRDDVFVGGGKNQESVLFLSGPEGFESHNLFGDTRPSEVTAAEFFDVDGDGDLDLYVAHGGKAFSIYSPELNDALYVNDGSGGFSRAEAALTFPRPVSTGDLAIADLNQDGLPDIVVGEAMLTNSYGAPGTCFVLLNQGGQRFAPAVEVGKELGLITAVETADVNGDDWPDIVLAGRYLPVTVLLSQAGSFDPPLQKITLNETAGLSNCLTAADLDADGDPDFLLGNVGDNNFFREGLTIFVNDFDGNGTREQIACRKEGSAWYPIHDIDELYTQLPVLKKKYRTYSEFAQASLSDLFSEELVAAAVQLPLRETRSLILWNEDGELRPEPLPRKVQYSTVDAVLVEDVNADGVADLLLGGNDYNYKPQFGRQDAAFGWLCYGEKRPEGVTFTDCRSLGVDGQIRVIEALDERQFIIGINNGKTRVYNAH